MVPIKKNSFTFSLSIFRFKENGLGGVGGIASKGVKPANPILDFFTLTVSIIHVPNQPF